IKNETGGLFLPRCTSADDRHIVEDDRLLRGFLLLKTFLRLALQMFLSLSKLPIVCIRSSSVRVGEPLKLKSFKRLDSYCTRLSAF
ncbi:MAG TPA: hypothetical protein V6D28_25815, partial [Leptolyngbyaceae cyanobacterium]